MPSVGPNKPHATLAVPRLHEPPPPPPPPLSAPSYVLQSLSSEARCVNTDRFKLS